ncbi:hypothetical protein MTO96_036867 [Rhipicephalus appendiculatus]
MLLFKGAIIDTSLDMKGILALDLTKAFDTIRHEHILNEVSNLSLGEKFHAFVKCDVAYEELWTLRRVLLNVDLCGTFHPREILRVALALQRHHASGGMSPDEVRRVDIALGLLGNSIGITCTASGATSTPPKLKREAAEEAKEFRGVEEETDGCPISERHIAEVGVAADAMCRDAA